MFSKTCEYAIRALIFIAEKSVNGRRVGIKEIAEGIESPEYFIAKILQDLSRRQMVKSIKGPNGGFFHDAETLNKSLADIVRATDGDKVFSGCGLGLRQCSETRPCPIHNDFKIIRKNIQEMLEHAKIGTFSKDLAKKLTFLKN